MPKQIAGVYLLFIILTIINASMDGLLVPDGREPMFGSLISGQVDTIQGAGIFALPWIAVGFVQAFWSMITWDYTYLNNDVGIMLKVVLFSTISIGTIIALIYTFWPILSSKIGVISTITGGLLTAAAVVYSQLVGL